MNKNLFDRYTKIKDAPLNGHTKSSLLPYNFKSLEDLNGFPAHELIKGRNIGKKTIREIQRILEYIDLSLGGAEDILTNARSLAQILCDKVSKIYLTEIEYNYIVDFLRSRTFFKPDSTTQE